MSGRATAREVWSIHMSKSPEDQLRQIVAQQHGVDVNEVVFEDPQTQVMSVEEAVDAVDALSEEIRIPDEVAPYIKTLDDAREYLQDPKGFLTRRANI